MRQRLITILLSIFFVHLAQPALFAGPSAAELMRLAYEAQSKGQYRLQSWYLKRLVELDPSNSASQSSFQAALDRAKAESTVKPWDENAVAKNDLPSDAPMPPAREPIVMAPGLGAWVYGDGRTHAKVVNAFNLTAPLRQRVRYLFPYSGSVSFRAGKITLTWDTDRAKLMADTLSGDAQVHLMLDGASIGASSVKDAEWDRAAREIAKVIGDEIKFAGVQFDIEPHLPIMDAFFARVQGYLNKPVGAAVGVWSPNTFKSVDYLALMAYDLAETPGAYRNAARDMVKSFMRDAHRTNRGALVGAPAIATHHEYESKSDTSQGPGISTKLKMETFVSGLRSALTEALEQNDPNFMGLSIWALHPEGGLHGPGDKEWYFPSTISPAIWDLLRLPVEKKL